MNFVEKKILREGTIKPGNVLKVDSFLNHQIDVVLLDEIARELKRRFADATITKVLTIEASGIAIACAVAREFGIPVVFAKKAKTVNLDGDMYVAEVESFTHKKTNQVIVSKKFLKPEDRVLIVDDFLANGCALQGLISIVDSAGAEVVGCGIVIEKGFQEGGHRIRTYTFNLTAEQCTTMEVGSNYIVSFLICICKPTRNLIFSNLIIHEREWYTFFISSLLNHFRII